MRISDWSSDVCSSDLLGIDPFGGRFPGDGFGAVFTEFERRRLLRVRPGTAGAIKARRLVHLEERARIGRRSHLVAHGLRDSLQRPPATGRTIIRSEEHTSALQSLMRISDADFCM